MFCGADQQPCQLKLPDGEPKEVDFCSDVVLLQLLEAIEDLNFVEVFGKKDSDHTEVNEMTMKKKRIMKDATMHPL